MRKVEYSTDTSKDCKHTFIRKKVGEGYHKFCIKCGKVEITSDVIKTIRNISDGCDEK